MREKALEKGAKQWDKPGHFKDAGLISARKL